MGRLYLPFFAGIRVDRGLKVSALAVHFSYIFFFPTRDVGCNPGRVRTELVVPT